MANLWCEARCVGLRDDDVSGCLETAEGAFGVRNAIVAAKSQGWRHVRCEWLCPVCVKRRAAAPKAP